MSVVAEIKPVTITVAYTVKPITITVQGGNNGGGGGGGYSNIFYRDLSLSSKTIAIPAGTWIDKITFRVKGISTVNISDTKNGNKFGSMTNGSPIDWGTDYQIADTLIINVVGDPIDIEITKYSI